MTENSVSEKKENIVEPFSDALNPKANKTVAPELNQHDRLKLFGRKLLHYMGIPQHMIREEVTIDYNGKRYRVDLVGYPVIGVNASSFGVAIECGNNKAEKIEALRQTFPLVLILPYNEFDFVTEPEVKIIRRIVKNYEQQLLEHRYYLEQIRNTRTEFHQIKTQTETEMKLYKSDLVASLEEQVSSLRTELIVIKHEIEKYRDELKLLTEFKEFCKRFGYVNV